MKKKIAQLFVIPLPYFILPSRILFWCFHNALYLFFSFLFIFFYFRCFFAASFHGINRYLIFSASFFNGNVDINPSFSLRYIFTHFSFSCVFSPVSILSLSFFLSASFLFRWFSFFMKLIAFCIFSLSLSNCLSVFSFLYILFHSLPAA